MLNQKRPKLVEPNWNNFFSKSKSGCILIQGRFNVVNTRTLGFKMRTTRGGGIVGI